LGDAVTPYCATLILQQAQQEHDGVAMKCAYSGTVTAQMTVERDYHGVLEEIEVDIEATIINEPVCYYDKDGSGHPGGFYVDDIEATVEDYPFELTEEENEKAEQVLIDAYGEM
jgi:hypothetical protein